MPVTLTAVPKWVVELVAGPWPEGDEDAMRRLGQAWIELGEVISNAAELTGAAREKALAAIQGATGKALASHGISLQDNLNSAASDCHKLGEQLIQQALSTQLTKYIIKGSLIALALQAGADLFIPGAGEVEEAVAAAATRLTVRAAFRDLIAKAGTDGARAAAARFMKTILFRGVTMGAIQGAGVPFIAETVQMAQHDRDWGDYDNQIEIGLVAGAAGGLVGEFVGGRAIGGLQRFITNDGAKEVGLLGQSAIPIGGAAVGGLAGAVAGEAAIVPFTGRFDFSAKTLLPGLVGGALGSMPHALRGPAVNEVPTSVLSDKGATSEGTNVARGDESAAGTAGAAAKNSGTKGAEDGRAQAVSAPEVNSKGAPGQGVKGQADQGAQGVKGRSVDQGGQGAQEHPAGQNVRGGKQDGSGGAEGGKSGAVPAVSAPKVDPREVPAVGANQGKESLQESAASEAVSQGDAATGKDRGSDRGQATGKPENEAPRSEEPNRGDAAKARADTEVKARADAEVKARADAEARARADAEVKARADAEVKARADAEVKARADAEVKARADAEAKARADAEAEAEARAEAEAKARADAEAKARADAEAKARAAAEAKARAEAEAKARADAEKQAKADAETDAARREAHSPEERVRLGAEHGAVRVEGDWSNREFLPKHRGPYRAEYSRDQVVAAWENKIGRKMTPEEIASLDWGCVGIASMLSGVKGGGHPPYNMVFADPDSYPRQFELERQLRPFEIIHERLNDSLNAANKELQDARQRLRDAKKAQNGIGRYLKRTSDAVSAAQARVDRLSETVDDLKARSRAEASNPGIRRLLRERDEAQAEHSRRSLELVNDVESRLQKILDSKPANKAEFMRLKNEDEVLEHIQGIELTLPDDLSNVQIVKWAKDFNSGQARYTDGRGNFLYDANGQPIGVATDPNPGLFQPDPVTGQVNMAGDIGVAKRPGAGNFDFNTLVNDNTWADANHMHYPPGHPRHDESGIFGGPMEVYLKSESELHNYGGNTLRSFYDIRVYGLSFRRIV